MRQVNWAIMSTGRIARDFVQAVNFVPGAKLLAVGSRSLDKAEEFARQYGAERAYGSYAELVRDEDIDVVYIATPTSCHYENAKLCLENGRGVLVEKSATMTLDGWDELCALADARGLFLMEGVWMRLHPAFIKASQWYRDGRIGDARMVKAELAWEHPYDGSDRIFSKALGGGNILDLGPYTFGLAGEFLGFEPRETVFSAWLGPDGADIDSSATLRYDNGAFAVLNMGNSFNCSGDTFILGTNGKIVFPDRFNDSSRVFLYDENYKLVESFDEPFACNGFEHEVEEVDRCILAKLHESPAVSHRYTRERMLIGEECKRQIGLTYEE